MPSSDLWRGWPQLLAHPLLAAALLASTIRPLHAQRPPAFERAWHSFVSDHQSTLRGAGIVGATIALVHDGEIVEVDYHGFADLETGRRVDENTIYHGASVTKPFTAVAIMQLRDQGLLGLDDPVIRYIPELRAVHNPFGPMDAITLRHLLSHSAGFRNPTWPWGGGESWHPHEPAEWSQLVAMFPYTSVDFEPGAAYRYSNPGIVFLGRTLEVVTADVYEAYIDKNIFRPLDMRRSYFDNTPWHLIEYRSNNYRVVRGQPVANGPEFNTGITVSNGGLNAPVSDLAKWLGFLMGAPQSSASRYDQVLTRSSLEEMWQSVIPIGESSLGPEEMGLSFFLYREGGQRLVGHTGTQKSFRSFILLDPVTRVGMIGAFNTAGGDETAPETERILDDVRRRAAREIFPLFQGVKASR
jgi:CubicO group peptidase (beta-lactamase class C family)